jgi:hypothetical protein
VRVALIVFGLVFAPSLASAACFDDLGTNGCTDQEVFPRSDLRRLSCQNLWHVRNTIYDENGYCFKTKKGQAAFDNSDCYVDDMGAVKLNNYEKSNVNRITQVEREKGCPR